MLECQNCNRARGRRLQVARRRACPLRDEPRGPSAACDGRRARVPSTPRPPSVICLGPPGPAPGSTDVRPLTAPPAAAGTLPRWACSSAGDVGAVRGRDRRPDGQAAGCRAADKREGPRRAAARSASCLPNDRDIPVPRSSARPSCMHESGGLLYCMGRRQMHGVQGQVLASVMPSGPEARRGGVETRGLFRASRADAEEPVGGGRERVPVHHACIAQRGSSVARRASCAARHASRTAQATGGNHAESARASNKQRIGLERPLGLGPGRLDVIWAIRRSSGGAARSDRRGRASVHGRGDTPAPRPRPDRPCASSMRACRPCAVRGLVLPALGGAVAELQRGRAAELQSGRAGERESCRAVERLSCRALQCCRAAVPKSCAGVG